MKKDSKIRQKFYHSSHINNSCIIKVPVDYTSQDIFIQVTNIDHNLAEQKINVHPENEV